MDINNYKHLTLYQRIRIRTGINNHEMLKNIALLGENIVKKLGVTYIPANCINLTPNLIKD